VSFCSPARHGTFCQPDPVLFSFKAMAFPNEFSLWFQMGDDLNSFVGLHSFPALVITAH
jgi:hypothetical protein